MVITASTPRAASAGVSAIAALPWNVSALDRVRFHTVTWWPAWMRRDAIGAPIAPSPRKPSSATVSSSKKARW